MPGAETGTETETYDCECGARVRREAARRTETYGGLDPMKWQTLRCPACGRRLKTVYVGARGRPGRSHTHRIADK